MPAYCRKRPTLENCDPIRIRDLVKAGVFVKQNAPFGTLTWGERHVSREYKVLHFGEKTYFVLSRSNEITSFDHPHWVEITKSTCNYGGCRFWFSCPGCIGQPCGRRVTALYRPQASASFLCRHCHDLAYLSSQEHDKRLDRAVRDLDYLQELLNSCNVRRRLLGARAAAKLTAILSNDKDCVQAIQ